MTSLLVNSYFRTITWPPEDPSPICGPLYFFSSLDFMVHSSSNPLANIKKKFPCLYISSLHQSGKTSILDELNNPHPPCLNRQLGTTTEKHKRAGWCDFKVTSSGPSTVPTIQLCFFSPLPLVFSAKAISSLPHSLQPLILNLAAYSQEISILCRKY